MKASKQEMMILGGFLVVVALAAGGYIWYTTRPPSGAAASPALTAASDTTLQEEEILALDRVSTLLDEQRIDAIVRSGVFEEPSVEGDFEMLPGSLTGVAVETERVVEVERPSAGAPGPSGEGEPVELGPRGPTIIKRELAAIDVAVTGIVLGAKTAKALVFSNEEDEGRWIDVPGEAFGYQVQYITMKGAVLEKDGRTYVLLLGANKKETGDYGVSGAESGRSGPERGGEEQGEVVTTKMGGPPPPGEMTPEMQAKMEMMRAKARASGRVRGGGPPGRGGR